MEPVACLHRHIKENTMRKPFTLLIALLLTACAPRLIPAPEPTPIPPALQMDTPTPAPDPIQDDIIRLAISDLAARLSIDPELVHIISAESTLWPDSSLGCPQPGEAYAQVLTEGVLIQLEADDQIYEYHTDTGAQLILCDVSNLPTFPVTPGEIDDGKPWMPVD